MYSVHYDSQDSQLRTGKKLVRYFQSNALKVLLISGSIQGCGVNVIEYTATLTRHCDAAAEILYTFRLSLRHMVWQQCSKFSIMVMVPMVFWVVVGESPNDLF